MTDASTHLVSKPHGHRAGLVLIAGYKLFLALLFLAVGVGALNLLHKDIDDVIWHLVGVLKMNPESRLVNFIFDKAELLNDPILKRIGFASFFYSALGILEAVGLYLEKAWAETLTVLITASFLPFEIHEVFRRLTWSRIGLLAVNLVVLLYLLYLLGERATRRARARSIAEDKI